MTNMKDDSGAPSDRLLAGVLKARAGAAAEGVCLEAETLAAWADETLDARERASVEAHAADCARCQAMLASVVRTIPPSDAAASRWRIPALGWLVPLTAAAAALAIWVAVPAPVPVQRSEPAAEPVEAAPAPRPAASADARTKAQEAPVPGAVAEKPAPAALEKDVLPQPSLTDTRVDAKNIAPAAPLAGASADSVAAPLRSAAPAAALSAESAARRELRFAGYSQIVSSNPATRFRLLPDGGVQRSADGGATWRTEVTGATEPLTAGSSPSPSVCWLVGPSSMVLLSTDGRSWRRLTLPEAADLDAVIATDGENATVRTTDGRLFSTTDGGRTWSRTQGL